MDVLVIVYTDCITLTCDVVSLYIVPDPPRDLMFIGSPQSTTVDINWLPPIHPRGNVEYHVEHSTDDTFTSPQTSVTSGTYHTLSLPQFPTSYIRVSAVNTMGRATSNIVSTCPGRGKEEKRECCHCSLTILMDYSWCYNVIYSKRMSVLITAAF